MPAKISLFFNNLWIFSIFHSIFLTKPKITRPFLIIIIVIIIIVIIIIIIIIIVIIIIIIFMA